PPSAETVAVVQAAGRAILQGFPCRTVDVRLDGPGEALESVLFRGGDDIDDFDAPAAVEVRCRGLRLRVTFLPGFNGAAVEPVMSTVLRLAALAWRPAAAEPGPAGEDVEAPPPEPVTVDPSVRRLYDDARRVARGDVGVLILGESGTGKEVLARFIHGASRRRGGPWVALNCAALPEDLLEAELFGIERGVATGVEARAGTFELADGGTLFLDEIGDMAPAIQAKLLRVLQEGEVYRLGGRAARPARVRVISATNQDLRRAIDGGTFRLDLFHRIADCTFRLPPLRERRADLANLATHFLVRKASEAGVRTRGPSKAALECLLRHPWPGNIRQLEREMARAALFLEDGELLQTRHLQPEIRGPGPGSGSDGSLKEQLDSFERGVIVEALARHGGQARAAAEALGVSRTTFYRRLQELEIPT
ncbi:MAG: sigma 54-interacting transcriptional regulator, partial [Acidobacteriota bacterium]